MNIGQRPPFSGGRRDSHEPEYSYVIITCTHYYMHFHIYKRVSIFRPNMLFKVYDKILSKLTYETLPALATYLPIQEGTSIFDVLRLNAQTKNLATLKMVC